MILFLVAVMSYCVGMIVAGFIVARRLTETVSAVEDERDE